MTWITRRARPSPTWTRSPHSERKPVEHSHRLAEHVSSDCPPVLCCSEAQNAIRLLIGDRDQWSAVVERHDAPSDAEINRAKRAVKARVKTIEALLARLSSTIDTVERERSKFPHIDDQELFTRKKFVNDAKAVVRDVRDTVRNHSVGRRTTARNAARDDDVTVELDPSPDRTVPEAQQVGARRRVPYGWPCG